MSEPSSEDLGHLTDADVAAYLDRGLSAARRDRIEAHLAGCAGCRREVLESQQLVKRVRPFRRASVLGGSLAAAAAAVLIVARVGLGPGPSETASPVRSDVGASQLVAHGPIGEDIPTRNLRFVWGATAGAVTYRLTVTGSDGVAVWSRSGTDTVVAMPDSIMLRPGQRYFWVVDALLGDGATRSTGIREFVPAR